MFNRIVAWLRKLNTHTVFGVGVGTALASAATLVLGPKVSAAVPTLVPAVNIATYLATSALPPAIIAAGLGKPLTVANEPDTLPITTSKGLTIQ